MIAWIIGRVCHTPDNSVTSRRKPQFFYFYSGKYVNRTKDTKDKDAPFKYLKRKCTDSA